MTPQAFITKWGPAGPAFHLNEEQGAQSHFIDMCDLLGVPKPGSHDGYLFEEKSAIIGGRTGYAEHCAQAAPECAAFLAACKTFFPDASVIKPFRM